MPRNVVVETLVFKNEDVYTGQVLGTENKEPHGYGKMRTKQGFEMHGYFLHGKNVGPGIFRDPKGNAFFGCWNENHKRHGRHMGVFANGKLQLQTFQDGKFKSACKPRTPAETKTHWKTPNIADATINPADREVLSVCGHTVCNVAGYTILFGGERKDKDSGLLKPTNDLFIYDKGTCQWNKAPCGGTPPPPSHGHTATAVGSKMVVIGGRNGLLQHSSVHVLDMSTGKWSCEISKGINLAGHSATLIGHKIYCIVSGNVFILDTKKWIWEQAEPDKKVFFKARVPYATLGHSAVAVGKYIFLFGGMITQNNLASRSGKNYQKCSNNLLVLDTEEMAWEVPEVFGPEVKKSATSYEGLPSPSWKTPRSEHSATIIGDEMVVVGGFTTCNPNLNVIDSSYLNDVQILDVTTMTWRTPPITRAYSAPSGSHCVSATGNDNIWVIGGRNHADEAAFQFAILHVGSDAAQPKKTKKSSASDAKEMPRPVESSAAPTDATVKLSRKPKQESRAPAKLPSEDEPAEKSEPTKPAEGKKAGWGAPVKLNFLGGS